MLQEKMPTVTKDMMKRELSRQGQDHLVNPVDAVDAVYGNDDFEHFCLRLGFGQTVGHDSLGRDDLDKNYKIYATIQ